MLFRCRTIQSQVQRQYVDARFAEQPGEAALGICGDHWRTRSSGMFRAFAIRGTWNSAPSGEISGSSPLPEVVTRSIGTAADGFSAFNLSTSSLTRSFRALLVGPRLDPAELAAL